MITTRLRQVRRLFCNDLTPPAVQRHNMRAWVRAWVRAVRRLGHRWVALAH